MGEYTKKTIDEFSDELASNAPVPGGGGASALAGALGAALGQMVGELTAGKKKYAEVEDRMREMIEEIRKVRKDLLECIDRDAEAFRPLAEAYAIPKEDPERETVLEQCLYQAAQPPMEIMEHCAKALELLSEFARKGSTLAVSDAGCGASLCKAAVECAALNVFVNTRLMKDRKQAKAMNSKTEELLKSCGTKADEIYQEIYGRMQ